MDYMVQKPTILYLDVFPRQYIQGMKAAGIRRYAAALGWETEVVPHEASRPKDISALLRCRRPVGCIVQCHFDRMDLPPSLFGVTRVVYMDPDPALCGGRVAYVSPDDDAIAGLAMRELAANRPSAYAYVGSYYPAPWNGARAKAFRELAGATGLPQGEFSYAPEDATYVLPNASESDRAAAHEARLARLAAWLATLPRRTAVMAVNDGSAADVFVAARAAGLSIPHDLSLVGVDNSIPRDSSFIGADSHKGLGDAADIPISTVMVDYEHAGFVAAKLLADGGRRATFGPMLVIRRKSTRGRGRRAPFVLEAVEIIRRRACDGLTPKALISRFPVSRWLFEMRFREAMGHSVLDEIHHVRLEKVCALLSRTDTPLGVIADSCGFGSQYALRDLFRATFKMSMREWRKRNR